MPAQHPIATLVVTATLVLGFSSRQSMAQDPRERDDASAKSTDETEAETIRVLDLLPSPPVQLIPSTAGASDRFAEPSEPSFMFRSLGVGMFAASATDVATTEWGLRRGYSEGNPLATTRSVRVAHHVVGPAAVWWTSEQLHRSGKRKLAWSLRIALMAAYSYAAIHNARRID